ncbi:MAG: anthranilate synthase component I [Pseudanabaenaceae cyanobacterium]
MTVGPSYAEFVALTAKGNFIPLYQQLVADMDTPVSAWERVGRGQAYSFLLESVEGGEKLGRYSLVGCDPLWWLEARGGITTQTFRDGRVIQHQGNPFTILKHCLSGIKPVTLPELPPSLAGLVGFWGYELIQWIEPRVPVFPCRPDDLPDGLWMQVDSLLVFDQIKRTIWAIVYADVSNSDPRSAYESASSRLARLIHQFQQPLAQANRVFPWQAHPPTPYHSNQTPAQFQSAVAKAKEYIWAGDIFQVVLSQRLTSPFRGDPFQLYRSLRVINPSPYMAYLHFHNWQMIGSSPEVMVKAEWQAGKLQATVRPIAGTRPRGATPDQDQALAQELLNDPKEIAEHIMLVDLGRNDLGRVCRAGTVQVDELMTIEKYSHVMHIVSNVRGELAPNCDAWDLLQACFPAGTVSGAPKIRAMEIIYELEKDRRSAYSGCYGYYDFSGQLHTAITIRTMIVRGEEVSVQAGAGIVADSLPANEYQETLNKAKALLEALRYTSRTNAT